MKCVGGDRELMDDERGEQNGGVDVISPGGQQLKLIKPIRRAKMNKRVSKDFKVLYSNIQGFTKKKENLV